MILQDNFKYCGSAPHCDLRLGAEGTLSVQEVLSTWKEFVSKLRSRHQSPLRRVLTFVLSRHLNSLFKTQEAKQLFCLAPADSYHVPDSQDTGPGEQEGPSSPLSLLTTRTKTKGPYAFFFFLSAGLCNEFLHSFVINNTYYNF